MISYILNSVLCSAGFLGYYFLFLERERNHHFKRFYLVVSLLASLIIPLITVGYVQNNTAGNLIFLNESSEFLKANPTATKSELLEFVPLVWLLVSTILMLKFCLGLMNIRKKIIQGKKISVDAGTLVLLNDVESPYSFWKWIFLYKTEYEAGNTDPKILLHEQAHVKQKHSLDLILCELILVAFWFNPVIYFYRRAIATNHEFLADEAVLATEKDLTGYHKLLFSQLETNHLPVTNHFFYNTKKRFIMMTTPKRSFRKVASALALPLAAVMIFVFSKKIYAQNQNGQENPAEVKTTASTPQEKTEAQYPGGIGAFRTAISKEFDTSKFYSGGKLQATVVFKIDEKGKASDFRVDGNNAAFMNETKRTVQKVAESVTWKPATENGKVISSDFKLPLTMVFESRPFPRK